MPCPLLIFSFASYSVAPHASSRVLHLGRDAADPTDLMAPCVYAGGAGTSRAIAQMKPVNSRAIAVATFGLNRTGNLGGRMN